jgi:hypothetical protein
MPPDLTIRAWLARAWADTLHRLGLHDRSNLAVTVAIPIISGVLFYWFRGRQALMDQVGWSVIFGLASFGLFAVAALLANLILAPYRIACDVAAESDRLREESERQAASLKQEIEIIRAKMPRIRVGIEGEGGLWYLIVRNDQGNANFRAEIRILRTENFASASEGAVYNGFWERTRKADSDIHQWHQDRLLIGKVRMDGNWAEVSLLFAGGYWDPNSLPQGSPIISEPQLPPPALWLMIVLSSVPPMEEPLRLGYKLSVDGITNTNWSYSDTM